MATVLLLHGFPQATDAWREVVAPLGEAHLVAQTLAVADVAVPTPYVLGDRA